MSLQQLITDSLVIISSKPVFAAPSEEFYAI